MNYSIIDGVLWQATKLQIFLCRFFAFWIDWNVIFFYIRRKLCFCLTKNRYLQSKHMRQTARKKLKYFIFATNTIQRVLLCLFKGFSLILSCIAEMCGAWNFDAPRDPFSGSRKSPRPPVRRSYCLFTASPAPDGPYANDTRGPHISVV
jgi:hypothetical protein